MLNPLAVLRRHPNPKASLKRVIIAACAGLATIILAVQLAPSNTATHKVITAAHDIPAGAQLQASDLQLVEVPRSVALPSAATSVEALVQQRTATHIDAGAPLSPAMLVDSAVATAMSDPGSALISVPLTDPLTVQMVRPGMHVQVGPQGSATYSGSISEGQNVTHDSGQDSGFIDGVVVAINVSEKASALGGATSENFALLSVAKDNATWAASLSSAKAISFIILG